MNNLNIAAAAMFLLVGCAEKPRVRSDTEEGQSALTDAEQVANAIEALPPWPKTHSGYSGAPFDSDDFDSFELAAIILRGFSLDDVEDGIELAIAGDDLLSREVAIANVFVLLRVFFDVPSTYSRSSVDVFSPYTGSTLIGGSIPSSYPLLWPVEVDLYDRVSDVKNFIPPNGSSHDILGEFAWMRTTFSQRSLPSCVGRCGTYDSGEICQCDSYCESYNDCCVDIDYSCGSAFAGGSNFSAPGGRPPPN